jgi:hypothetical protein
MKIELVNNGELADSRRNFGTLEIVPNSPIKPTRIFMRNMQTLVVVYHTPKKLTFVNMEENFGDGKISVIVGHYANWYEECSDELLIPLMAI